MLLECGASSYRFLSSAALNPKRHEDVSHSESFAKSSRSFLPFAFICVFRGLKAVSKNINWQPSQHDARAARRRRRGQAFHPWFKHSGHFAGCLDFCST